MDVVYDGDWTSVTFIRSGSGNGDSVSVRWKRTAVAWLGSSCGYLSAVSSLTPTAHHCFLAGATEGGPPPFSLPRLGHSGAQSHGGAYRDTKVWKLETTKE